MALGKLNAQVLVDEATPFFWLNLRRFELDAAEESPNLPTSVNHLRRVTIDAFFEHIPRGVSFRLRCSRGEALVFPKLRMRFGSRDPIVSDGYNWQTLVGRQTVEYVKGICRDEQLNVLHGDSLTSVGHDLEATTQKRWVKLGSNSGRWRPTE